MDQQTGTDRSENQTETERRQWGLSAQWKQWTHQPLNVGSNPELDLSVQVVRPGSPAQPMAPLPDSLLLPCPLPAGSPTPTFSAVLYKAEHKKELGSWDSDGAGREGRGDWQAPPNSKTYPPPSFQESAISTHPHRERRESGRVSSCPPSLTTVTPPPTKSGVGYLSKNRYLDRLQHTGSWSREATSRVSSGSHISPPITSQAEGGPPPSSPLLLYPQHHAGRCPSF